MNVERAYSVFKRVVLRDGILNLKGAHENVTITAWKSNGVSCNHNNDVCISVDKYKITNYGYSSYENIKALHHRVSK